MREDDFSQIIVETAEEFPLLSVEGILRWFEICAEKQGGLVAINESTVDQVIGDEPQGSCAWLSASQPVAEAVLSNRQPMSVQTQTSSAST